MLKKKITYTDFNDQTVTEEFWFHLSKAELIRMEMESSGEGGLQAKLQAVAESNDGKLIIDTFQDLVLKAYGQRSEDGKRFIKNQQLRDEFAASEAFGEFFMELATNADSAAEFINGIMPANLEQMAAQVTQSAAAEATDPVATENKTMNLAEAARLSQTELMERFRDGWVIDQNTQ